MYRYMTQELAEQLLTSGEAKLGGDRKDVTVLFSDIRGYTNLVESMEPEEVVSMLNEYFGQMAEPIFTHKGTLDKYIGDAIMAVFRSIWQNLIAVALPKARTPSALASVSIQVQRLVVTLVIRDGWSLQSSGMM